MPHTTKVPENLKPDEKLLPAALIQSAFAQEEGLQLQITNAMKDVELIIVDSEEKIAIANTRISTINSLMKVVEKLRTEIKSPYFEAGKDIDAYAKNLSNPMESAKKKLNQKVLGFKKSQEAQLIIEQNQAKQKQEMDEKAKLNESNLLRRIREQITARLFGGQFVTGAGIVTPCEPAKNIPECTEIYLKLSQDFPLDFFKHLKKEAEDTMKELSDTVLNHQKKIAGLVAAGTLEQYLVTARAKADGANVKAESETVNKIAEESKKEEKKEELAMKKATKGIRKTIAFEIVDKRLVPDEFLSVDAVKVNEWIKNNKEKVQDGLSKEGSESPISGLRFYEHSSYVAK